MAAVRQGGQRQGVFCPFKSAEVGTRCWWLSRAVACGRRSVTTARGGVSPWGLPAGGTGGNGGAGRG
ncbi:MAG: hypothetical protein IPH22_05125 [Nitrosomonas sp.]|nr:hypothetical protein [Nitrosomonas sp.]